jgi:hypothetical protein
MAIALLPAYTYPQQAGLGNIAAALQMQSLAGLQDLQVSRKSKYRGVTWDKRDRRWRVRINCLGVQHHVGR